MNNKLIPVTALSAIFAIVLNGNLYAQQRPLTSADIPKTIPQIDNSLQGIKAKNLTEKLLLAPYDGAALRLALSKSAPEFLNGTTAEEIITELSTLRSQTMEELLPDILTPLNERSTMGVRAPTSGAMLQKHSQFAPPIFGTAFAFFAAVNTAVRHLPNNTIFTPGYRFSDRSFSIGGVNEYEYVINGMTANVREEITFSIDKKHVKFRHLQRQTVEQNGDPTAVGRYVVERGTSGPEPGKSDVKAVHPRRLKPTSTHRVTTETIREVTVDRCPDAKGITNGVTLVSLTIRGTAGATCNGSPLLIESIARGNAKGQVSDAAVLTGFEWEVTSQSREESLNRGQNYSLKQSMTMRSLKDVPVSESSFTVSDLDVNGVGTVEDARKLKSVQDATHLDTYLPLLDAYEKAENEWRSGKCVELVVASGAAPSKLSAGEARKIVVEARHSYEPSPIEVPVTGTQGGGTITPKDAVKTPSATFTFKSEAKDGGGGAVKFKSVSRRGIAKDVDVDYIGSRPVYKVTVNYQKTAEGKAVMKAKDQVMSITLADEEWQSSVFANTTFYYYAKPGEKEININREEGLGNVLFFVVDGYSEYTKKQKAPEMEVLNSRHKDGKDSVDKVFSSQLLQPNVSFSFKGDELQDFDIDFDFPEDASGKAPVSGGVLLIRGDKDAEDAVFSKRKIADPQSLYKTEHRISFSKKTRDSNTYGYTTESEFIEIVILSPF